MHTSRFIHKLSLIIFTITFIVAQTATAQVPFNRSGSVAGQGAINGTNSNATGTGKGLLGLSLSSGSNCPVGIQKRIIALWQAI